MATGNYSAFPIPWNDSAVAFGLPLLAGANVWSGQNKFTGTIAAATTGTTSVEVSSSATGLPIIRWTYAGGATDQKLWDMYASSSQFVLRTINDAGTLTAGAITIDRSGQTPTLMTVGCALATTGSVQAGGSLPALSTSASAVQAGLLGGGGALRLIASAGATDSKVWDFYTTATQCVLRMTNDANNSTTTVLTATRSGMTVSSVALPQGVVDIGGGGGGGQKVSIRVAPAAAGADGIRLDTASVAAQLLITGGSYSYAGVGANQAWLYTQGTTDLNLGPDGAGNVRITAGGAQRMQINGSSGAASFNGPVAFGPYTLSTLPSAASFTNHFIMVTNATGGAKLCFSNGTNWIMVYNNAIVS